MQIPPAVVLFVGFVTINHLDIGLTCSCLRVGTSSFDDSTTQHVLRYASTIYLGTYRGLFGNFMSEFCLNYVQWRIL